MRSASEETRITARVRDDIVQQLRPVGLEHNTSSFQLLVWPVYKALVVVRLGMQMWKRKPFSSHH